MIRRGIGLGVSLLLWSAAYNIILPLLPLMAFERGATPSQAGLLQGAAYAGAALALLPAGWLADRFDRRTTLSLIWASGAVGTLLMGWPGSWVAMVPGAFLALAGAGAMPALAAMAADVAPTAGRRRIINIVFAAAPAGLLVGSSSGGLIAQRWGLGAAAPVAAAVTLAAIALLWVLPVGRGRQSRPESPRAPTTSTMGWRLLLLGVPVGLAFLLLSLPSGFMTPYLRDVVGLSLSGVGITNAQLAVGQLAWSALFSIWPGEQTPMTLSLGGLLRLQLDRGTLLAMAVCLGANAAFGFLFPIGSLGVTVVALLMRGALFSLQPLGMSLVSELTGNSDGLATRFSLMALIVGGSAAVAPVVSGYLYEQVPALPFLVAGGAAALGAALLAGVVALGHYRYV